MTLLACARARASAGMKRAVFAALFDGGQELLWAALASRESELAREREASMREREFLAEALSRERDASSRERALLLEREASAIADLQKEVDFSNGLITVRSALESIVTTAFPSRSVTDALRTFCDDALFQQYLEKSARRRSFPRRAL